MDEWGDLANQIGERLVERGWTLTTAESCTGGGVAFALTQVSGSSAWFQQGWVTYSNKAKVDLLGIDPGLIETYGVVSAAVAIEMARLALNQSKAQMSVAVTGIAGPTGGTSLAPVGCVYIAWGTTQDVLVKRFDFIGNRQSVRKAAINEALLGILAII